MAEHTLSPSTPGAEAALAALRTLAATPNPDARLVTACERYMELTAEVGRLYRRKGRGYLDTARPLMTERDRLEDEISKTPARTQMGRLNKAQVALTFMGKDVAGTVWAVPRSILKDFIRDASTRNEPWVG